MITISFLFLWWRMTIIFSLKFAHFLTLCTWVDGRWISDLKYFSQSTFSPFHSISVNQLEGTKSIWQSRHNWDINITIWVFALLFSAWRAIFIVKIVRVCISKRPIKVRKVLNIVHQKADWHCEVLFKSQVLWLSSFRWFFTLILTLSGEFFYYSVDCVLGVAHKNIFNLMNGHQ